MSKVIKWRDKLVTEMTRDELIDALSFCVTQILDSYPSQDIEARND